MPASTNTALIVLRDGKFDQQHGTSPDTLDTIFKEIRDSASNRIVVHFHGGLVDRQAGTAGANFLNPIYRQAGAYPIFFIWESGWKEILEQKLPAIFNEGIFQKIQTYLTRFAKGKVDKALQTGMAKSAGDLPLPKESAVEAELATPKNGAEPYAEVDPHALPPGDGLTEEEKQQFIDKMKDDPQLDDMVQEIANSIASPGAGGEGAAKGAAAAGSTKTLMSPEALSEMGTAENGSKGIISTVALVAKCAKALETIIERFVKHRDHGFQLTIVEEILRAFYVGNAGKFLWEGMKAETKDAFGFDPACGGTQFLTKLEELWKSGHKPQIALVGHSAGSIYVCRFLQEVQNRKLPEDLKFNVVFIAPACGLDLLAETLKIAGNRIMGLRVFGMGDELERKNAIVPVVYPSSLLYFVSGVLEDQSDKPIAGMARYYQGHYVEGQYPEIDFVRKFELFQKDHALVWSASAAGDGISCDMTSHGGWAQAAATVKSVLYILDKGYGYGASPA